ncbi:MAG: NAD-dependent epimerase/dehydratase family protein [Chloroflexi bacterium]|nr:MAG: NAD-dependent epimerase/dehydratase family protein [Chloroflexota bacterium]
MRILITGGAGFIGSHLANFLYAQGHYVRVLDDMTSGDPDQLHAEIYVKRGDVRDIPTLWSLLQGVDVVYHLAALVSVPASILYPRDYNDVNVGGTVALLEACRDVGVGRVVLASSATIYGDQPTQPVSEGTLPAPAAPYAVTKMAAEQYLFTMGALVGFEAVSLRIFNAYGPGQPLPPTHGPVIPYLMQQVAQNGSVIIFGDGTQTRDFVYISDVVQALVTAGVAPNVDRQIINIGSGQETSINQAAELIGQVLGKQPRLLHNREKSVGTARLVADIAKAQVLLDYTPRMRLAAGLEMLYRNDPLFKKETVRKTNTARMLGFAFWSNGV